MKTIDSLPRVDLDRHNIWQYANAPKMAAFLAKKKAFYEAAHTQFWKDFYTNFFDLDTANDWGCAYWGQILGVSRTIKDNDGQPFVMSLTQYRLVLKGEFLKYVSNGSVPDLNKWLNVVFSQYGKAYSDDNFDMTIALFAFLFDPPEEVLWLLKNVDWLPRPAGVGWSIERHSQWETLDGELMFTLDNQPIFFREAL